VFESFIWKRFFVHFFDDYKQRCKGTKIYFFFGRFLAQIEMKSPQLNKVVFISVKKRLKEALFKFCKNTFF